MLPATNLEYFLCISLGAKSVCENLRFHKRKAQKNYGLLFHWQRCDFESIHKYLH